MSQNDVKLNEIKDFAFLADKSYKTANGKKGQLPKVKEGVITNDTTNSSFKVIDQIESANDFSATVFRNIPQRGWGMTGNSRIPKARQI